MSTNVLMESRSDVFARVNSPDLGKLLPRVNVAFLLMFHGILGFAGGTTKDFQLAALSRIGIPSVIGFPIGLLLEVVCPLMAILGVYSRLAGLGMAIFVAFAIGLAHLTNGHLFMLATNNVAYYLETQFFFLWNGVAVFLLGVGQYGLNIGGRWNN